MIDQSGEYFGKLMANHTKEILPQVMHAMKMAVETVEEAKQNLPPSEQIEMVEAIIKRLHAEMEASCDRAYKDLDAILHDQEVVIA